MSSDNLKSVTFPDESVSDGRGVGGLPRRPVGRGAAWPARAGRGLTGRLPRPTIALRRVPTRDTAARPRPSGKVRLRGTPWRTRRRRRGGVLPSRAIGSTTSPERWRRPRPGATCCACSAGPWSPGRCRVRAWQATTAASGSASRSSGSTCRPWRVSSTPSLTAGCATPAGRRARAEPCPSAAPRAPAAPAAATRAPPAAPRARSARAAPA